MKVSIPGYGRLVIEHVVMDFNGTIAVDGILREGVRERIVRPARCCHVHVLTSDTRGTAARELAGLPVSLGIYGTEDAGACKGAFVGALDASVCACIGNGSNDTSMFATAALSIAVLETEGLYAPLLTSADMLVKSSVDALDLLLDERRLISGLRR